MQDRETAVKRVGGGEAEMWGPGFKRRTWEKMAGVKGLRVSIVMLGCGVTLLENWAERRGVNHWPDTC